MSIVRFTDKKGQKYPYLYIDKVTGVFYVQKRIGKSVKKKSLNTCDFQTAKRVLIITLNDLGSDVDKSEIPNELIKDYYLQLFEEKKLNGIRESTLRRFTTVWEGAIEPYFGNLTAQDINAEILPKFIIWHKRNKPAVQLYNTFKYLKNIFRFMNRIGVLETKNIPLIEIPKDEQRHHDKKKGRIVTDSEFNEIFKHSSERFKIIVSLGFRCGMRKMEIGSLRMNQVKKTDGRYFIYLTEDDTKTGMARVVPIPKEITPLMEDYYPKIKSDYLFPTMDLKKHVASQVIDREWQDAKTKAKIKGRIRFHDLRGSCATNYARRGVNPIVACTLLGMGFSMYQKIYLNLTTNDLILAVDTLSFEDCK